jgi:NADH:ubiquinone oxidoreductase subunit 6 (subunit J)
MTLLQILFMLTSAVILFSALMVVTAPKMLHAAFWLIATLFGVAVLFVFLQAGFFAVVQVVVYIGAIAILIIFAVMLTRRVMTDTGSPINANWWLAAITAGLSFAGLFLLLRGWKGFLSFAVPIPDQGDAIAELGQALVSQNAYVLPFEVASILLLAALIGAIYIARERKEK